MNATTTINPVISKRHINAVLKFNADLEAFSKETGEDPVTIYEDAFTPFTLKNVRLEGDDLVYDWNGREEREPVVMHDDEEGDFEDDGINGIAEYLKFWRSCLKRAKRYWSMSPDKLDRIQEGEIEDKDPEDE